MAGLTVNSVIIALGIIALFFGYILGIVLIAFGVTGVLLLKKENITETF